MIGGGIESEEKQKKPFERMLNAHLVQTVIKCLMVAKSCLIYIFAFNLMDNLENIFVLNGLICKQTSLLLLH